jgi:hypothetical protein
MSGTPIALLTLLALSSLTGCASGEGGAGQPAETTATTLPVFSAPDDRPTGTPGDGSPQEDPAPVGAITPVDPEPAEGTEEGGGNAGDDESFLSEPVQDAAVQVLLTTAVAISESAALTAMLEGGPLTVERILAAAEEALSGRTDYTASAGPDCVTITFDDGNGSRASVAIEETSGNVRPGAC